MKDKHRRQLERQYEVFGLAIIISAGMIGLYILTSVQLS